MLGRALADPWLARHCARTGMPLSTTNPIPREDSFNLTRPPSIRQNLAELESGLPDSKKPPESQGPL